MNKIKYAIIGGIAGASAMIGNASADAITDNSPQAINYSSAKDMQEYYQSVYDSLASNSGSNAAADKVNQLKSIVQANASQLKSIPYAAKMPYTTDIKVSGLWIKNYNKFLNATTLAEKTTAKNTLMAIADTEGGNNKFNGAGLDNTVKYDPSNIPQSTMDELNFYFVTLLNSIHRQLGDNTTVYANENLISFANDVANGYEAKNISAMNGHNLDIINRSASKFGLKTANFNQYENVTQAFATSTNNKRFTQLEMFEMVHDAALNFTIYDVYSNFDHIKSLLSLPTVGLAFSTVTSDGWKYTQLHVQGISNAYQLTNPNTYDKTFGIVSDKTIIPNRDQLNAQLAYNKSYQALQQAKIDYDTAIANNNYDLTQAKNALDNANIVLSNAKSDYDSYMASYSSSMAADNQNSIAASQSASIAQSVSDSIAKSQSASIAQSLSDSTVRSLSDSIAQSTSDSIAQSTSDSIVQSTSDSIPQSSSEVPIIPVYGHLIVRGYWYINNS